MNRRMRASIVVLAMLGVCSLGSADEAKGDSRLAVAQSDIEQAKRLRDYGKYAQAVPLVERALKVREEILGGNDLKVAECLDWLGVLHLDTGSLTMAEPLIQRAIQIRETVQGRNHPDLASSLHNLAAVYDRQVSYPRAVALYLRALQIREVSLGPNHPTMVKSLINLSIIYEKQGAHDRAEPLLERVSTIEEIISGTKRLGKAIALEVESQYYLQRSELVPAERLLKRALKIRESTLGFRDSTVAASIANLAGVYYRQDLYSKAEPLYWRALTIGEAALGPDHPGFTTPLINLASIYYIRQDYRQAETLYLRALKIMEAALGPEHRDVASTLTNLAGLYYRRGVYWKAEPLFLRALQITEATLGPNHADVASALYNLARFYHSQEEYGQAEPLYLRAIKINEAALGSHHPSLVSSLRGLVELYSEQGFNSRSISLYLSALKIREVARVLSNMVSPSLGYRPTGLYETPRGYNPSSLYEGDLKMARVSSDESNIGVGRSYQRSNESTAVGSSFEQAAGISPSEGLGDPAAFAESRGQFWRAKSLLLHDLKQKEANARRDHPDVATALSKLALFHLRRENYKQAEGLLLRALRIREETLGPQHPQVATTLDNLSKLRLAQGRLAEATQLLKRSLVITEYHLRRETINLPEARFATFQHLLSANNSIYLLARSFPNAPDVLPLALATALLRKDRSVDTIASVSRTIYRSLDAPARELFERLRALRTQYAALSFDGPRKLSSAEYQQRLGALEVQAAALEAALAQSSAPLRAQKQLPGCEDIVSRVAATLPKDAALIEIVGFTDQPLVPEFQTPLDETPQAPNHYLAFVLLPSGLIQAVSLGPAKLINEAVAEFRRALASPEGPHEAIAKSLYHRIMVPLIPLLGAQRRLFIAADGDLHLVPFSALYDGHQYLLDTYDVSYLTSGRDLLLHPADATPTSAAVVVFADPDFNDSRTSPATVAANSDPPSIRSFALDQFRSEEPPLLGQMILRSLPGTRQEAHLLQRLFSDARLFLGPQASASALFQVTAPRILHIATHGFFFLDDKAPRLSASQPRAWPRFQMESSTFPSSLPVPKSPMLRSGIVTARRQLVTALELTGLNLWGTQLVVLSACVTGLGDTRIGQGVAGLRRAFVIAGAETIVTSLWNVRDDIAPQLMDTYYRGLVAGRGRAEAMLIAMRAIRAEHPHPYYWAPFIVVGHVEPLRAQPGRPS